MKNPKITKKDIEGFSEKITELYFEMLAEVKENGIEKANKKLDDTYGKEFAEQLRACLLMVSKQFEEFAKSKNLI